MIIYPAIDLYEGKVVRLKRGDYKQMTVYNKNPLSVANGFKEAGATALHIVDLEGARDGKPANLAVVKQIAAETGLLVQVGGGIRTAETINEYLSAGIKRVILGTAAVSVPGFLTQAVSEFKEAIVVSVDIKDGFVAIKGWTETSDMNALDFCEVVDKIGVKTLISTDISKDGMMNGTNMELYGILQKKLSVNLIASGGVSTLNDVRELTKMQIHGAILGKALYTGDIDLTEAILAAKKAV